MGEYFREFAYTSLLQYVYLVYSCLLQLSSRLGKTFHDLQDEREMNQSLATNQGTWQSRVGTLEAKLERKEEV